MKQVKHMFQDSLGCRAYGGHQETSKLHRNSSTQHTRSPQNPTKALLPEPPPRLFKALVDLAVFGMESVMVFLTVRDMHRFLSCSLSSSPPHGLWQSEESPDGRLPPSLLRDIPVGPRWGLRLTRKPHLGAQRPARKRAGQRRKPAHLGRARGPALCRRAWPSRAQVARVKGSQSKAPLNSQKALIFYPVISALFSPGMAGRGSWGPPAG